MLLIAISSNVCEVVIPRDLNTGRLQAQAMEHKKEQIPWRESARELYRPSDCRLSANTMEFPFLDN
jgi:hypothetical protein